MAITQNNPLVSIIVPCYNQEDFIDEALQSVYEQTFVDWECIVIDDGSTDKSEERIQKWISKDSRFIYYYKDNGGIAETRNYGIKCAKGKFILPLDGDDKLHNDYVRQAIAIFTEQPATKLVYCDSTMFGAKEGEIRSGGYNFQMLLLNNTIPCTGIFRKKDFELTDGYRKNMKYGLEDWDFWVSLLDENDEVVKLSDNLVFYRIKEISRSTILKEQNDKNEAMLLQLFKNNQDKYLQHLNPVRDRINHLHYKDEYKKLQQTAEYKIGKIICYPFRLIAKVFRRLFK